MSKTILIADDEPSLRLLVRATLSARKFTVVEATNGQEALNLARQLSLNLVLLDVNMPFLTGFQVCEELRKSKATADLPIIILTAKGGQDDKEMALNAGANFFLTKPFRPTELLSAVDKTIGASIGQATTAV